MKKIRKYIIGFLPVLSIIAVLIGLTQYKKHNIGFGFEYMIDDIIAILLISVITMIICFIGNDKYRKIYLLCSAANFVLAIRLVVSPIMYLLTTSRWTVNIVICSSACVLTMLTFLASLSGAFLLKKRTIHISVHIISIIHMIVLLILSATLFKAYLIFSACLPISFAYMIKDYYMQGGCGI